MLLLQFRQAAAGLLQLGAQGLDQLQITGKQLPHQQLLGHQVAGPAFVLGVALLVGLQDALRFGTPAFGADRIHVVLHRLGPLVEQQLIHGVGIDQRLALVMGQQALAQLLDHRLGVAARLQGDQLAGSLLAPGRKVLGHARQEAGELGMGGDRGLQLRRSRRQFQVAGP